MYTILGYSGWGSCIAEALFELAGLPYQTEDVDPSAPGPSLDRLKALNPLGQLPTVVLPDGQVLTESAAIAFYVADLAPEKNLVPPPGDPTRPVFLRWLVFLVAAIYPTFTYGDFPGRFVTNEEGRKELRASTDDTRKNLWLLFEAEARGPFFLGERFSAIDVYLWAMVRWRPGHAWFAANTPKLVAIAKALDEDPRMQKVKQRNFPQ